MSFREYPVRAGSVHHIECAYLCILCNISGLVILPSFVCPEEQRALVRWSLKDHARHPNETNLDTHYILPDEGLWTAYGRTRNDAAEIRQVQPRASTSTTTIPVPGPRQLISNEPASKENYTELASASAVPAPPSPNARPSPPDALIPKLRWANIGWYYHWGNKQYDFTRGKIPVSEIYSGVCKDAVKAVPWERVFESHVQNPEDWGDEPKWDSWAESYGMCSRTSIVFAQIIILPQSQMLG